METSTTKLSQRSEENNIKWGLCVSKLPFYIGDQRTVTIQTVAGERHQKEGKVGGMEEKIGGWQIEF